MVALWVPRPLLVALDDAVTVLDTDRSKFIRKALRDRLQNISKRKAAA